MHVLQLINLKVVIFVTLHLLFLLRFVGLLIISSCLLLGVDLLLLLGRVYGFRSWISLHRLTKLVALRRRYAFLLLRLYRCRIDLVIGPIRLFYGFSRVRAKAVFSIELSLLFLVSSHLDLALLSSSILTLSM